MEVVKIKPKRILCAILILVISTSTLVYAEDSILTLQDAINAALSNSVDVMKYSNTVEVLKRDYADTVISSRQMKDMLEIDERFRKLSRKRSRTVAEEAEYQLLQSILGSYMSISQRMDMDIASQLSPSNMNYMISLNKSLLESTKNNIYLSVYSSFNTLSKTEDSIMVKKALINNLETSYKTAATKYALGKLSYNSLNVIKLDLQKAKIELNKLTTERQKNIIQLNSILGIPLDIQYTKYQNDAIPNEITLKALDDYIASAFANREDYKLAKQYAEIKQKEFDIVKDYYYFDTNVNNKSAQIELNNARNQLEVTKVNIQLQVLNSYNDFQSKLLNLEKGRINRDLNERALNETKSRYSLGLTTELELTEANINYSESSLTYLSSLRDAWQAKLNLDSSCGIVINNN